MENIKRELNDCSVLALSQVASIPYETASSIMSNFGRLQDQPVTPSVLLNAYISSGLRILPRMQPLDMKAKLQSGKYIVWCRGHVFCVIDGVMQDKVKPEGDTDVVAVFELGG